MAGGGLGALGTVRLVGGLAEDFATMVEWNLQEDGMGVEVNGDGLLIDRVLALGLIGAGIGRE